MVDTETQKIDEELDPYLKSPKTLHLEMPLYHELDLSNEKLGQRVYELVSHRGTIDAYCIWCNRESVFHTTQRIEADSTRIRTAEKNWVDNSSGFDRVIHTCSRNANHSYYAYYLKNGKIFTKIGQWPSSADFQIPQAEKYRKILGEEQYKELTKGIGLAAHGVGIGSFVYVRRVFENLIEEARTKAQKDDGDFPETKYNEARMDEKIKLVKDHLPDFLVENRTLYGILSKGIHELTEDECLEYFETVKIGIEQILDEKISEKEKAEKAEKARKAIQKVHGKIANS